MSDEAFALLLIDNYLVKWRTRADEEDAVRIGPVGGGVAETKTAVKYTGKAQGQCTWGG